MNSTSNTSGKMSIAKVAVIGIVGIALGVVVTVFSSKRLFVGQGAAPMTRNVVITLLDDDGTGNHPCNFLADDGNPTHLVRYKFPVIKPRHGGNPGDTLSWAVRDGRTHPDPQLPSFDVNFPTGATPFTDSKGAPKRKFTNNDNNSGDSTSAAGDYPYESVIFHTSTGDIPCSNARDPGGHVDN